MSGALGKDKDLGPVLPVPELKPDFITGVGRKLLRIHCHVMSPQESFEVPDDLPGYR